MLCRIDLTLLAMSVFYTIMHHFAPKSGEHLFPAVLFAETIIIVAILLAFLSWIVK